MTIEIDHIGLSVSDYEAAKKFYVAAMAPLRMGIIMEFGADVTGNDPVFGMGADGKPFLWVSGGGKTSLPPSSADTQTAEVWARRSAVSPFSSSWLRWKLS